MDLAALNNKRNNSMNARSKMLYFFMRRILFLSHFCNFLMLMCCLHCQQRSTKDEIIQRLVSILLELKVRLTEKKFNEHKKKIKKKIKRLNETTRWSLDSTVKSPKYVTNKHLFETACNFLQPTALVDV